MIDENKCILCDCEANHDYNMFAIRTTPLCDCCFNQTPEGIHLIERSITRRNRQNGIKKIKQKLKQLGYT